MTVSTNKPIEYARGRLERLLPALRQLNRDWGYRVLSQEEISRKNSIRQTIKRWIAYYPSLAVEFNITDIVPSEKDKLRWPSKEAINTNEYIDS